MLDTIWEYLNDLQEATPAFLDINQIVSLAITLLVARLIQTPLGRLFRPLSGRLPSAAWSYTLIHVARRISLPVTALALVQLATEIFQALLQNTVLLQAANRIIVVWVGYRFIAAIIAVNTSPEKSKFWAQKVLLPTAFLVGLLNFFSVLERVLDWGIRIETLGWRFTIGSALLAVAIIIGCIALSRWIRQFLDQSFLAQAGLEPGLSNTISKLAMYAVVTVGVLIALGSLGISLTALTVVAGGLSVGLAFGMQEIFNNFISGFILLFERSLKPGDIVEIDDNVGTVQKIGIRSTTIKTRDNIELIIPNSRFLTEVVTNLTRSENLVRTRISVGVTYSAQPREVQQALLEAATKHPHVLARPEPTVQFKEFGDSSLNFELFVWTDQAIGIPVLTSDLRYNIWDALAVRNIEIPFPQRDIHIRSAVPLAASVQPNGKASE